MSSELPIIKREDITLRPITIKDTDLIVRWRNNPYVKERFLFRDDFTINLHETWMKTKIPNGEVVQYIIEKEDVGPIGSVYFRDLDYIFHSGEFGIFIGVDEMRGRGYGSLAAKSFVDFGFSFLKLHRISLRLLEDNKAAYQSYLSVGFQKEGVFRDMVFLDGKYRNIVFMAIINDD